MFGEEIVFVFIVVLFGVLGWVIDLSEFWNWVE